MSGDESKSGRKVLGTSLMIEGDVIDILSGFEANTFDACFCDPPYLLEFMGRAFDKQHKAMQGANDGQRMQAWHAAWCHEAYRVLKPGAFVLAFGGTRTVHRLTSALEDVGFEVRDTLCYLYGSGFPKSLDISKSVDKSIYSAVLWDEIRAHIREWRDRLNLSNSDLNDMVGSSNVGCGMARHWTSEVGGQHAIPSKDQWLKLKESLGWPDCPLDEIYNTVKDGAERPVLDSRRGTLRPGFAGSTYGEKREGEFAVTGSATKEATSWQGYGTALKPAVELLTLAMKPTDGTFAQNALTWGVAGLNIDGSRIGTTKSVPSSPSRAGMPVGWGLQRYIDADVQAQGGNNPNVGRWPSNLLLSHSESCTDTECHPGCPVRLLDEQAGDRPSSGFYTNSLSKPKTVDRGTVFGSSDTRGFSREEKNASYAGETGGPSRFFYTAKVSTRERSLGGVDCKHVTLKPMALTEYLSRLLLPPSRTDGSLRQLIVPFAGAGSEVAGALRAGWDLVIGIENDAESVQWAEARIAAAVLETESGVRAPSAKRRKQAPAEVESAVVEVEETSETEESEVDAAS